MKSKKGFTLAEAMLAMGIVAVISMLTVPTLKHHSEEKQYVAGVKKAYNSALTAISMIELDRGPSDTWNDMGSVYTWFKDMMNGSDISVSYDTQNLDGSNGIKFGANCSGWFSSPDGMIWGWCTGSILQVDTNGAKTPNIYGVDVHEFKLAGGELRPSNGCTKKIIDTDAMPWVDDASITSCPSL